jgi:RHS repeat-associated protein
MRLGETAGAQAPGAEHLRVGASLMNANGTTFATYDAQDRLVTYGGATYTYGANGELQGKTNGGAATSYAYDVFGNLLGAGLPDGTAIGYVVDGQNRRVGTQVNGTLTAGFLYQDQLNAIAQLNGSGSVVSRFVFGSKPNVPDYYTTSAGTFRVLSDHLGSPRLIVNTVNGSVVEEIDYDEFGNVTNDTAPGTMPFGFAGGLRDLDTGLMRFGTRDYDASVGRWTSKDPVRFGGGQLNFYTYAGNEPVNQIDSNGKTVYDCWHWGAGTNSSLLHEYECVIVAGEKPVCFGWGGDPNTDIWDPQSCAPQTDNACMDACTMEQFEDPSRFQSGYNPFWNNCYQFADGTDAIGYLTDHGGTENKPRDASGCARSRCSGGWLHRLVLFRRRGAARQRHPAFLVLPRATGDPGERGNLSFVVR